VSWHPTLDDIERRPDGPQTRPRRGGTYAEGTGPLDLPLGRLGGCWCGEANGHDWPGKADGAPHPREATP
jgi:hypothetical protein